jgi:AAA+ ATPase superfamily predicted ATPase
MVCGSVSSWIERNILNSADFVGRISSIIDLKELSLKESSMLMDPRGKFNATETAKILSVTGGVPRYLEEIQTNLSADQNIKKLCFSPEGFLFSEFDRIFNDIFNKRASKYHDIMRALVRGHHSVSEICKHLQVEQNGVISEYLDDLVHSGFLARDFNHPLGKSKPSSLSRYRISDNYLRFYLRYIEPEKSRIQRGLFRDTHISSLPNWNTIMGLQFENLVHANSSEILNALRIDPHHLVSAGPYFQTKTARNRGACQIDLLIESKRNIAYVCEIKFRQQIKSSVISEVQKKIDTIQCPKKFALRPVLIYDGEIEDEDAFNDYFDACIPVSELLR